MVLQDREGIQNGQQGKNKNVCVIEENEIKLVERIKSKNAFSAQGTPIPRCPFFRRKEIIESGKAVQK